jgi:hypothetical protein
VRGNAVSHFRKRSLRGDSIGISRDEQSGWSQFLPGRRNQHERLSTCYGRPIAARNLTAERSRWRALKVKERQSYFVRLPTSLSRSCLSLSYQSRAAAAFCVAYVIR